MPNEKILIIDDDPIHLRLTRILLSAKGYIVESAETGQAAIEVLRAFVPNLIITDYQLPDIDGLELARQVRNNPLTNTIPIVLLTAGADGADEKLAREAGCVGFIMKPIRAQSFAEQVRIFVQGGTSISMMPGAGSLVLVVNDDSVERRILSERLVAEGFKVAIARDGADGLDQARRLQPAVIVGDILMPRLDGFKMCATIREDIDLQNIPVVLTTSGSIQKNDELMAQGIGANAFVLRTADMREVVEAVRAGIRMGAPNAMPVDPGLVESLRRYFLEEGERQTIRLMDQVESGLNRNALRRMAHRWAGVAGTFGYPQISETASELEMLAQRGSLEGDQLRSILTQLSELFMDATGRR